MLGYVSECEFKLQFEDSFKRFFKPLCFHAMSFVKDADIAKDIVHDVFLTTWTQREKIDFTQPMLPYYLSLTRNRSLNYLDHLKVRARHEENESYKNLLYAETDYSEHEELIRQIMNRINQLPDRCGEVMRLCFIECKKYKEIAEILGVSVNTVKTHISLGLKILYEEYITHYCGRNSFHTRVHRYPSGSSQNHHKFPIASTVYADATIGKPASNGCVRLMDSDAYYIWKYMPTNTTVISY